MDVPVSLFISLLLLLVVAGAGGSSATNSNTAADYWRSVLPETAIPQAVLDQLTPHAVHGSPDDNISSNNLKFVNGLRKIGPKYERVKPESHYGDKQIHDASHAQVGLKEVFVSNESQGEEYINNGRMLHKPKLHNDMRSSSTLDGSHAKDESEKIFVAHGPEVEEILKEVSVSYGLQGVKDSNKILLNLKKILAAYRPQKEENLKEVSVSSGSKDKKDLKEVSVSYGIEQEGKLKEVTMSYGSGEEKYEHNEVLDQGKEDPNKATMSYGSKEEDDSNKATMSYGSEQEDNPNKLTMSYGSEQEDDPNKLTISYGSEQEDGPNKLTLSYGSEHEEDPNKVTLSYGSEQEDPNKVTMSYGSQHKEEGPNKVTMSYGSEKEDPNKVTMSYGSQHKEEDPHKLTMAYGPEHDEHLKTVSTKHETHTEGTGQRDHRVHDHTNRQKAGVFFVQDMLRPGSIITPTIRPTTSLPRLLPRHIASSIPFSTEGISDIIAMFAPPASLGMAREIRWTLDTCKHPRTLPGEKAGCATSLESLVELPASLLGTQNVCAFSAANLPLEAPGTPALRGRYNVTAVRKISGQSSEIVTCHDLTYPYAVYYCHTANPTAAYTVTLASVEHAAGWAPATIEALAVCHLDTSKWSPKHPFFELHNLKPGEVTVCHFLTKLSIIWVPGSEQGDAHAAAR